MAGRLANRHNEPKEVVKIRIRKNDTVKVIAGKDKGKVGRVLEVNRETGRILVEGVQMSKKHVKPNPAQGVKGGIAEREAPIHVSNVMIVTSDGHTSRIGVKVENVGGKTRRIRIARKTGETLDKK
ncbi:50S ribosomal protein L24 [uncultured Paludibaculum sp.]|uniref:50S ribosomal protein L24 n=1 Tax=uncultured Paludibaculum sp. TaxID=1765020 RepID=UPI00374DD4ED